MSVHNTHPRSVGDDRSLGGDRYCHHCREIALVFDPATEGPCCRACGESAATNL